MLSNLQTGLSEFRNRVAKLGALCRERGWRCLFLTQPTIWRPGLSPRENDLLLFGWWGPLHHPKGYLNANDLARAISQYNNVLMEQCRQDGSEFYDLAAVIPKDVSMFLDDCHFNEGGDKITSARIPAFSPSHKLKFNADALSLTCAGFLQAGVRSLKLIFQSKLDNSRVVGDPCALAACRNAAEAIRLP